MVIPKKLLIVMVAFVLIALTLSSIQTGNLTQYPQHIKNPETGVVVGYGTASLSQTFNTADRKIQFNGVITTTAIFDSYTITKVELTPKYFSVDLIDKTYGGNAWSNNQAISPLQTSTATVRLTSGAYLNQNVAYWFTAPIRATSINYVADLYCVYDWTGTQTLFGITTTFTFQNHMVKLASLSFTVSGGETATQIGNLGVYSGTSGVGISLTGAASRTATSTSGYTLFSDLPVGSYTATLTRAGYNTQTLSASVTSGTTTDITAGAWVMTGTVVKYGNLQVNTIADPVVVEINGWTSQTKTSSGQVALFSNIQVGSYTVEMRREGYTTQIRTATVVESGTVIVSASTWVTTTPPPEAGSLTVTVTNIADNTPISGARVSVGTLISTTDATGRCTINNIVPGIYTIKIEAEGYNTTSISKSIVSGPQSASYSMVSGTGGGDGDEYAWSTYGYLAAVGGIIIGVMVFAFAPIPPKLKAFIALAIALAGLVAAHMFNIGGI